MAIKINTKRDDCTATHLHDLLQGGAGSDGNHGGSGQQAGVVASGGGLQAVTTAAMDAP